jgi:PX domain
MQVSPNRRSNPGRRPRRNNEYATNHIYSFASTATASTATASTATATTTPAAFISPRGSSHPNSVFKLAPKLVIRAARPYIAKMRQELSFQKDDYFFVIDQRTGYYEVINPVQKLRGLVPIDYFEELKSSDQVTNLNYYPISPAATPESLDYEDLDPPEVHQTLDDQLEDFIDESVNLKESFYENVCFVDVPDVQVSILKKKWVFTILLRFYDGTLQTLFRSYDEFFNLQLLILLNFPTEAGYDHQPRIIPFLPIPEPLDENEILKRKNYLSLYLNQLLFSCPKHLIDSDKLETFFAPRQEDISTTSPLVFDSSAVLLDLIDNLKIVDKTVKIRLTLGRDIQEFQVSSTITYNQLRREIEEILELSIEDVLFKDEAAQIIVIYGDKDLGMLLKMEKVSIYVS